MSETGKELQENNEQIVYFLNLLRNQRREIDFLIDKQEEEKNRLEMEIERIYYKLTLICKSLATRKKARVYYDQTIKELEEHYRKIVESSGVLLNSVKMGAGQLEQIMDKKIGTGSTEGDDRVPIIPGSSKDEAPTKDGNLEKPKEQSAPPSREQSPTRAQKKKKSSLPTQPPPIQEEPSKEQSSSSSLDSPNPGRGSPQVASTSTNPGPPSNVSSQLSGNKESVVSSKKETISTSSNNSKKESIGSGKKESIVSSKRETISTSSSNSKKESIGSNTKKHSVGSRKDSASERSEEKRSEHNKTQTAAQGKDPLEAATKGSDEDGEIYLVVEKFRESDNDTLYDQDSLNSKKASKESLISVSSHSLSGQNENEAKVKKKIRVSKTEVTQKKQIEHEIMVRVEPGTTADTEDVVVLKKPGGKSSSGISLQNQHILNAQSKDVKPHTSSPENILKSAIRPKPKTIPIEEEDSDSDVPVSRFGQLKSGSNRRVRRLNSGDS